MAHSNGAGAESGTLDGLSLGSPRLTGDNGSTAISVKSVWKVFGAKPERALTPEHSGKDKRAIQEELSCVVALQDVNFDVQQGETFVIMGLSGSGKSTMVRCLIRLIEPTAGEISIDGEYITGMSDQALTEFRRKKIAMVFQHYGLMPHRTVLDNAAWGLEVQGLDKASRYTRTQEVIDLVGLSGWEDAYPRQLSGGMQQRVGLARALAVNTEILLMDEPFSGLDPLIRRQMQDELLRLQDELQKTIVFITHDLNEALKLGDRIAIMHDGMVAQIGSPEDIVLRPEDEYVGEFTQDVRLESVLTAAKVMVDSESYPDGTPRAKGRPPYHRTERRRRCLGRRPKGTLHRPSFHRQRSAGPAGLGQPLRPSLGLRRPGIRSPVPRDHLRRTDPHCNVQRLPHSHCGRKQRPSG